MAGYLKILPKIDYNFPLPVDNLKPPLLHIVLI